MGWAASLCLHVAEPACIWWYLGVIEMGVATISGSNRINRGNRHSITKFKGTRNSKLRKMRPELGWDPWLCWPRWWRSASRETEASKRQGSVPNSIKDTRKPKDIKRSIFNRDANYVRSFSMGCLSSFYNIMFHHINLRPEILKSGYRVFASLSLSFSLKTKVKKGLKKKAIKGMCPEEDSSSFSSSRARLCRIWRKLRAWHFSRT